MRTRLVSVLTALSLLAGCAIHPLPEDVTRVTSFDIVRQIRCETRDTLRERVIQWMEELAPYSAVARPLAVQYRNDPASIRNFRPEIFDVPEHRREVLPIAQLFFNTGIAYTFDFTITEENDISAGLGFVKQRPSSLFSLGLGAGANRTRGNERLFTVTDTFSGLLTGKRITERYCEGTGVGPNYIYPIAGRIGVDKLVNEFIFMTLFGQLAGEGAKPGDASGPPTMTDNLTFTTTITASANPSILFTPVTPAFQLLNASLNASAGRTDIHKVTLGLAIDPVGLTVLSPLRDQLFSHGGGLQRGTPPAQIGTLIVGTRVIGGGTPSERLAVIAVDQVKSREIQLIPPQ